MVRLNVDIDILIGPERAFASVTGPMELVDIPASGDSVSLMFPANGIVMAQVSGFSGVLKVSHRIFQPSTIEASVSIGFEQIVVGSLEDAETLIQYFREGFGLKCLVY